MTEEEWFNIRIFDVGSKQLSKVCQLDSGLDVNDLLLNDNDWKQFNVQTAKQAILINEIFSFKKEYNEQDKKPKHIHNYITIKMKIHKINEKKAIEIITSEIKETTRLAFELGDKLKNKGINAMDDYVNQILSALRGHHYWSTICERFK